MSDTLTDAALFRSLRLSAGLTQAQVGAEIGLHVTMINRYEKGRAPIPKAVLIALECVARHRTGSADTGHESETPANIILPTSDSIL